MLRIYKEQDLLISTPTNRNILPIFEYINANDHKQKYYPDIYIISEKKIIEVKSEWWYNGHYAEKYKGRYLNNIRKMNSVKKCGYAFEFWIFDNRVIEKKLKVIK